MSQNTSPLVSVLMTVYNREQYVATAIESVLAQSFIDFELIIVDDGSSDRSAEIIQYFVWDKRVRICPNDKNLGQFMSRNRAAELARGKYLKYLDSDDALLPHCLEIMTHMIEQYPEAGMLLWSSEGDDWYPFQLSPKEIYRRFFYHGQRLERAPLSTLLKKEAFDAVGGFDLGYPLCSDMEIICRMARYYPALYGPHGLVFYRVHDGQVVSVATDSKFRHIAEQMLIIIGSLRHPDCPLPLEEKAWHLTRMLYGVYRKALELAVRQGRWATASNFLRSIGFSLREFLPLISKKPAVPPPPVHPDVPNWTDFPCADSVCYTRPGATCLISIVIAPEEQAGDKLRLCLDGISHQRLQSFEVLVTVDDGQHDVRELVSNFKNKRVRCVEVQKSASITERFNHAARLAVGTYCKFIGPELPLLYPYHIGLEYQLLDSHQEISLLVAGALATKTSGFLLSSRETVALEIATKGEILRASTAGMLFRREAFNAVSGFQSDLGVWAAYYLCLRLAVRSSVILGPYGLYSTWRTITPPFSLVVPPSISTLMEMECVEQWGIPRISWMVDLHEEGRKLLDELDNRCQWTSNTWLPYLIASTINTQRNTGVIV